MEINEFFEFFALSHFISTNIFYLTHFYVFFVNILKKGIFSDCPDDQFECDCHQSDGGCAGRRWRSGCIRQSYVCDGHNNCRDWSDEKFCLNTKLYCRNDECVERSKVNDGKVDMTSGYDEFVC